MKTFFFTCMVTLLSATYTGVYANVLVSIEKELTLEELKSLNNGELILKTEEVKDSPWPIITYYALVNATPLDCIALFAGYDIQKDYVPKVIKSKPIKHITSTDVLTEYELSIPFPLPNAHYVHGAKIFHHGSDYETQWYMVESSSAEVVNGSAYFKDFSGKTLFKYRSFIKPKSALGSFVKSFMLKDIKTTITAIVAFIEKSKRENSPLIPKYSEFITRALNGEFVYQTIIDKK